MNTKLAALRSIREKLISYSFLKKDCSPLRNLNSGEFGLSNLNLHIPTNRRIITKQIYLTDATMDQLNKIFFDFVLLMQPISHFLTPPVGFIFNNPMTIATEEAPFGSLSEAIRSHKLTSIEKCNIAFGISMGMKDLHCKKIIHGDLKTQNVLLKEDGSPMISDYGIISLAQKCGISIKSHHPDCKWLAPEILKGGVRTKSSDVYAYGVLLYDLYQNEEGKEDNSFNEIMQSSLSEKRRLSLPSNAPKFLQALVRSCTSFDHRLRPSFKMIVKLFQSGKVSFSIDSVNEIYPHIIEKYSSTSISFRPLTQCEIPSQQNLLSVVQLKEKGKGKAEYTLEESNEKTKKHFLKLPKHTNQHSAPPPPQNIIHSEDKSLFKSYSQKKEGSSKLNIARSVGSLLTLPAMQNNPTESTVSSNLSEIPDPSTIALGPQLFPILRKPILLN